jgi:hypothetical protein
LSTEAGDRGPALALLIGACAALAAASLLLPFEPVFDAWAWLVWGREGLGLDTGGGPSWKPLPVVINFPLTLAGDAAPELWLLVVRTGWLLCLPLAWLLSGRVLGRLVELGVAPPRRLAAVAAGALAVLAIVLLRDPQTPWFRQASGGLSEPLMLAFVLAAAECHFRGRRRVVLALLLGAGLIRPEAWALAVPYAVWLGRSEPRFRALAFAGCAALPLLWFVPDLLSSGSLATGVDRAAAPAGGLGRLPGATADALLLAPVGLLLAAAWATVEAWRSGDRAIPILAGAGLASLAATLGFTLLGFAGLARFGIVFGAAVAVVGSAGLVAALVRVSVAPRPSPAALAGAGLAAMATLAGLALSVAAQPEAVRESRSYADDVKRVRALVEEVGAERIVSCPPVRTTDVLTETAFAWELDAALADVRLASEIPASGTLLSLDGEYQPSAEALLASRAGVALYRVSCAPASSSSSGRIDAGVAGASR